MNKSIPYLHLFRYSMLSMLCMCWMLPGQAQQQFTISGYVRDTTNGESLTGATVYVKGSTQGVQANTYGYYALTLPAGEHTIVCSFLGYREQERHIRLEGSVRLNILMTPRAYQAQEVVVTGQRKSRGVESTEMGRVEISSAEAKKLPSFLG